MLNVPADNWLDLAPSSFKLGRRVRPEAPKVFLIDRHHTVDDLEH
jgi:hypothetical protein